MATCQSRHLEDVCEMHAAYNKDLTLPVAPRKYNIWESPFISNDFIKLTGR